MPCKCACACAAPSSALDLSDEWTFAAPARSGRKDDAGKLRHSLIPPGTTEAVLQVLEHGAAKYGDHNWMEVDDAETRYYDAAMRHLLTWWSGDPLDDESHLPHLAHAIASLTFLLAIELDQEHTL